VELITNPFALLCMTAVCSGILVCIVSVRRHREFKTVKNWKTAQGEIIESLVRFSTSGSSEGSIGTPRYHVSIRYKYKVNRRTYRGRRKILAGSTYMYRVREDAERVLRLQYAVGSPVHVHYNPRNPKSATLNTKVDNRLLMIFFLAGIALSSFAGAAFCGIFLKKGSLMASFSTPFLLVAVAAFVAVIYMVIRTPGDILVGDIGD